MNYKNSDPFYGMSLCAKTFHEFKYCRTTMTVGFNRVLGSINICNRQISIATCGRYHVQPRSASVLPSAPTFLMFSCHVQESIRGGRRDVEIDGLLKD